MKTPERSRTSHVPVMYSPFAQKFFCHDGMTHTHQGHRSNGSVVRVRTDRHTDTHTATILRLREVMKCLAETAVEH